MQKYREIAEFYEDKFGKDDQIQEDTNAQNRQDYEKRKKEEDEKRIRKFNEQRRAQMQ